MYDSKRMLGTTYDDLCKPRDGSAVSDLNRWTFSVERGGASGSQPIIVGELTAPLSAVLRVGMKYTLSSNCHAMPRELPPCAQVCSCGGECCASRAKLPCMPCGRRSGSVKPHVLRCSQGEGRC